MKKVIHYLINIGGAILALFFDGVLQIFYFWPKKFHQRFHLPLQTQAIVTALLTVIILWFIFWLYKKQLAENNDWGFNKRPHWDVHRFLITIVGFFLITILGTLTLLAVSQGKTTSANQQSLNAIAKQSGNLYAIMVCFIAPFCEEVIFRGMFFNTFFTKATTFNKWAGILVSGFLFAYMHDPRITKFIVVYWVLGCVLAWVYMTTKDLRYSMITHMCYNSLGFIHLIGLL